MCDQSVSVMSLEYKTLPKADHDKLSQLCLETETGDRGGEKEEEEMERKKDKKGRGEGKGGTREGRSKVKEDKILC